MLLLLASITAVTIFSSCDGSEEPTDEEVFLKKISNEWTLTSGYVKLDGVDVSPSFAGMTITFTTSKTYAVTHAPSPLWPASGSFKLEKVSKGVYDILRDDGVVITVSDLTEQTLTLSLDYDAPGGRKKSISGHYEFFMNR